MEADWSVEAGDELPGIVVPWGDEAGRGDVRSGDVRAGGAAPGLAHAGEEDDAPTQASDTLATLHFVDLAETGSNPLASSSARVEQIAEARDHPVLASALTRLNAAGSRVFTSKCDVWELASEEIDPSEFDAAGVSDFGMACYVDVVFRDAVEVASFAWQEGWMRRTVERLRAIRLRCAAVELVLRGAEIHGCAGFAVSVYVSGCGASRAGSQAAWAAALEAVAGVICSEQRKDQEL
ncbi:MAG TPA: hypothetical protein VGD59_07015 [Acidisarcina sp.]